MFHPLRRMTLLTAALLTAGGILPLLVYWAVLGQLPTRMPEQAIQMLNAAGSPAVLVDVRAAADFARLHIEGAQNWPIEQVLGWRSPAQIPPELQGKTLLLVCDNGWLSARAVDHLRRTGAGPVFTVRGGMQEWAKAAWRATNRPQISVFNPAAPQPDRTLDTAQFIYFTTPGGTRFIPEQAMTRGEQSAQAAAGLLIKPLYTFASLALALLLLRETAPDLSALRWGLLAFFAGEIFCYINFIVFGDDSYLSEYLHSFGMVAGFGFIFYALWEGIEARLFHFNDINQRCAALSVCLLCSRYRSVVCRARRVAQLFIPLLVVLCAIPLLAPYSTEGYNGVVYGVPYYYARFGVYQFYENRLLPLLALLCFAVAYIPLWSKTGAPIPRLTQVFTAAGLGALSFALVRLSLGTIYTTKLVWFSFWEELTELVFIVAIAAGLWIFRIVLFPRGFGSWTMKLIGWFNA